MSEEDRIPGYAWFVLWIAWTVLIVGTIGNFAIGTMLPSLQEDIGFGTAQAGYLSGIGWFLTSLLTIPITLIVTRVRPKTVLVVVFLAIGAAWILQGLSNTFGVLFVTRALGVGMAAAIMPALVLLKQQWVPLTKMAQVNGVEAFTNPVGQILGTALVPILIGAFAGWRPVVFLIGGVVLVLAVVWVLFGRERRSEAFEAAWNDKTVSPIGAALKEKAVWLLAIGWPGTSLVWIAMFTFFPTYAVDKLGLTISQAGFVLSALPIGSMIASLVAPWMADKLGYDKPMIWGWGFVLPIFYFMMLPTNSVVVATIASFLAGFGAFAFVPVAFTLLYKLPGINPKTIAMGTGIIITIATLGATAGGVLSGVLAERLGNLYLALAICCLSPLTMGICGLFLPELGRKAMEKQALEAAKAPSPVGGEEVVPGTVPAKD
jgi:predicted MFS family arabinose efflux permease